MKSFMRGIFGLLFAYGVTVDARLLTIPTTPFKISSEYDTFSLRSIDAIVVDSKYAYDKDEAGETLTPPSLYNFAGTLQDDLETTLGIKVPVLVQHAQMTSSRSIFLTIDKSTSLFLDIAGRNSAEGYSLTVSRRGITITGGSPLGAWWGTRTLLQAAAIYQNKIPHGSGIDTPGWRSRGVMLDAARHYYPPEFLVELCAYLSYFKQNELHLHLSDNMFINYQSPQTNETLDLYSSFRLLSTNPALAGLARFGNESYTKNQFSSVQEHCAKRGVTIIPEIEAPAHALAIVRWKPELGLEDPSMLNLTYPDTIPTLKSIWKEFLPWFFSKTVHIGADEYSADHIADYTNYVNELGTFIKDVSNKTTRIWATFTPTQGGTTSKDIEVQHWASYADNPYHDYIKNGYQVLNSDFAIYIDLKWSPYFKQSIDETLVFHGNPDGSGFSPNIFDRLNATNNPPRNHPSVIGHIAPLWSDWGRTASTYLEAYYALRDGLPGLADKQWGGDILKSEYDVSFTILQPMVPGQNLDRRIESKFDTIFEYKFRNQKTHSNAVKDTSGNNYHGKLHGHCKVLDSVLHLSGGCYLETPLSSKGRNYTLSFWVNPTSFDHVPLFSGGDSTLWTGFDNFNNITMVSGNHPYAINYTLPLNTWTRLELVGKGNSTTLNIFNRCGQQNGRHVFTTRIDTGDVQASGNVSQVWVPMAFEAPIKRIGERFRGQMKDIFLKASTHT